MKILIDIGHPAHVHLFRNYIKYLKKEKNQFIVVSRDKEITNQLLEYYKIPYISISKQKIGLFNMFFEMILRDIRILLLNIHHNFDIAIGTSVSIGHLSFFTLGKVKSFNFNEDDDKTVPLYAKISYPFNTKIIIPESVEYTHWKKKRILHDSYHELAYLHPNNFVPDENVLKKYGLQKGKYIIARFSSLQAHHDIGISGISNELWLRIKKIISGYKIIESIEGKKTDQIDIWDMHHILAFTAMVVSDSQTMTMEAAILGIPSVRINSFARQIGVLKELEFKYKLTKSFFPNEENLAIKYIENLINLDFNKHHYLKQYHKLLNDKIDFNEWMIKYFKENINR